ncbi:hypothetical protein CLM62_05445 [Streptomyces sp. SA15]|uniref:hypothetical protein n=1 Tax=Streptomyces sp. SA15 TaxID=934019 RepID=UPI000BAEC8E7|nr:hypothetical protein [Streptomyces sp. SA15]PAZ16917.1 hypothetical protein CLM62_05445 [Streptomyces sp. SA15]
MPEPASKPQRFANERYSVTLLPPAVEAIAELTESTGLSKADVINRAVQIYAYLDAQKQGGADLLLRQPDGTTERLHIV